MAIEQKIVTICDICGFMVEANGDGIGCASAPDNWSHGKNSNIDICPRCAERLERPEWKPRNGFAKGFSYADARKK